MSYMEDKEWDLLDKRINESVTPVAKPLQRAVIKLDEDTQDMLIEMFNGDRDQIIFNTKIIEGLLKTDKHIEILITTLNITLIRVSRTNFIFRVKNQRIKQQNSALKIVINISSEITFSCIYISEEI